MVKFLFLILLPIILLVVTFILYIRTDNSKITKIESIENIDLFTLNNICHNFTTVEFLKALIISLANKGYIRITKVSNIILYTKTIDYNIEKLKDYNGNDSCERNLLNILFMHSNIINLTDLCNCLRVNGYSIVKDANENKLIDFHNNNIIIKLKYSILPLLILLSFIIYFKIPFIIASVILVIYYIFLMLDLTIGILTVSLICILPIASPVILFFLYENSKLLFEIIIVFICLTLVTYFVKNMDKDYKNNQKIVKKYKKFIKNLSTKELLEKHNNYIYDLLPHVIILNEENLWFNKFDNKDIIQPNWFITDSFSKYEIIYFINKLLEKDND